MDLGLIDADSLWPDRPSVEWAWACGHRLVAQIRDFEGQLGPILCNKCKSLPSSVSLSDPLLDWLRNSASRRTSARHSNGPNAIAAWFEGGQAELAAACILCPGSVAKWGRLHQTCQPNKCNDLRAEWTCVPKPIEIKFRTSDFLRLQSEPNSCYYVRMCREAAKWRLACWCDGAEKVNWWKEHDGRWKKYFRFFKGMQEFPKSSKWISIEVDSTTDGSSNP